MTFSSDLALRIAATDFSECSATVIGYGKMGRQHVKALHALGVKKILVCSRSEKPLQELQNIDGVTTIAGGYLQLGIKPQPEELAIIATPISELMPTARYLRELGFRKFLIEKPISLNSKGLRQFRDEFSKGGIDVACAYNRVAYPALLEARHSAQMEGGITSCTYTFTEFSSKIGMANCTAATLRYWGIANSLHVMSMAHSLIGFPKIWNGYHSGSAVAWHPTGSIFVGSGVSKKNIPFAYHADWGSTGRWSVEIHTKTTSFRFCPLEKLYCRLEPMAEWQEVPLKTFAEDVKVGFVEQVAAMLNQGIRKLIPLFSLEDTFALICYGENVFGYARESTLG